MKGTTVLLVLLGSIGLAGPARATQLPVNDNTAPPYLGSDPSDDPDMDTDQFYIWLNRSVTNVMFASATPEYDTWSDLEASEGWFYHGGYLYMQSHPNCIPVVSIGMLPGSGNTPLTGTSLAIGAEASNPYGPNFQTLAQNLINIGMANAIIRLGWEWNGNWYPWEVTSDADAKNFAAYWKNVVPGMRDVAGANFKFLWGGAVYGGDSYPIDDAYPAGTDSKGRRYVDLVGVDVYDACYPTYTTEANAWNNYLYPTHYNGIASWQAEATKYNVPMSFPEFGLLAASTTGGGDDPAFITQMFNYIQNSANNVYYANYYDSNAGSESKISPVSGYTTPYPNSADTFYNLFHVSGTPTYNYTFNPVIGSNEAAPVLMDPHGSTVGAQLILKNPSYSTGQVFTLTYTAANAHTPGVFRIAPYGSSTLSVGTPASPANGSAVTIQTETGATAQRWLMLTWGYFDDVAFASDTTPQVSGTYPPGSGGQWLTSPGSPVNGSLLTTNLYTGTLPWVDNGQGWDLAPYTPAPATDMPVMPVWGEIFLACLLFFVAAIGINLNRERLRLP
jgi:hypothetical protein